MLNVSTVQGNSLELRFKVTDPNGSAINFSTWDITEILWVVRAKLGALDNLIEKRYSLGEITISDAAEGQFIVNLNPDDLGIDAGNYVHEAVIQTADDGVYTVVVNTDMDYGKFSLRTGIATP